MNWSFPSKKYLFLIKPKKKKKNNKTQSKSTKPKITEKKRVGWVLLKNVGFLQPSKRHKENKSIIAQESNSMQQSDSNVIGTLHGRQRRRLYVVVGPDSQSAKWRHHNRRETSETTPHLKPIPFHFSFIVFHIVRSIETMFQWTSDCVFNVYCLFAAAPPPFVNNCHAFHFSRMFEDIRAELKRQ